jgi:hypothetical protein
VRRSATSGSRRLLPIVALAVGAITTVSWIGFLAYLAFYFVRQAMAQ